MSAGYRRLSASGLDVAARCPGSCALPEVDVGSTPDQVAGTRRHEVLDAFAAAWSRHGDADRAAADVLLALKGDDTENDAEDEGEEDDEAKTASAWLETMHRIDMPQQLTSRGRIAIRVETGLSFGLNLQTGEVVDLGRVDGRAYTHDAGWVCGTCDWLLHFADGGPPVLVDFKGSRRATPARDNLQTAFYAGCVASLRGYPAVDIELRYIEPDGSVYVDSARCDDWWLDGGIGRILEVGRSVEAARAAARAGEIPPIQAGTHCRDCASLRVCPAQTKALASLVAAGDDISVLGLSPAAAGQAWVKIESLLELLKRLKSALRERAITDDGLPLGEGERLAVISSTRRKILVDKAIPLLRDRFGSRADSIFEITLKSAKIDRLAVEVVREKGGKVGLAKAELWAGLKKEGAVSEAVYKQLRVKKVPLRAAVTQSVPPALPPGDENAPGRSS